MTVNINNGSPYDLWIYCSKPRPLRYSVKTQFREYIPFASRGTEGVNLLHVKLKTATSIKLTHH